MLARRGTTSPRATSAPLPAPAPAGIRWATIPTTPAPIRPVPRIPYLFSSIARIIRQHIDLESACSHSSPLAPLKASAISPAVASLAGPCDSERLEVGSLSDRLTSCMQPRLSGCACPFSRSHGDLSLLRALSHNAPTAQALTLMSLDWQWTCSWVSEAHTDGVVIDRRISHGWVRAWCSHPSAP